MDLGLRDRVALITGGSAGIGLATARTFLEEGARVAICARGGERLEAAAAALRALPGARVYARVCDVRQPDQVAAWVEGAAAELGGVDVLVNNAGQGRFLTFRDTHRRAVAPRAGPEVLQHHPPGAGGVSLPAGAWRRRHRRRERGARAPAGAAHGADQRGAGRGAESDALAGRRVRAGRHPRQQRDAGHDRERAVAPPLPRGRGGRLRGRVAGGAGHRPPHPARPLRSPRGSRRDASSSSARARPASSPAPPWTWPAASSATSDSGP